MILFDVVGCNENCDDKTDSYENCMVIYDYRF